MIGTGRATGAITFVNALPTGIGCAAGISLVAEAVVELDPSSTAREPEVESGSDSPLVRSTLNEAIRRWGESFRGAARLRLRSEVPVARGLKSSSAVGVAVGRATASALHRSVSSEEVARLVADVSQSIGLSATGGFDDALAASEPGIHLTENASRKRLRSVPVPPEWEVVLFVPPNPHPPSPTLFRAFRAARSLGQGAVDAALQGNAPSAMERNTELVESVMGYSYAALRHRLTESGAVASGVSGLGPALAAVVPRGRGATFLGLFPAGDAVKLITNFSAPDPPGPEGGR